MAVALSLFISCIFGPAAIADPPAAAQSAPRGLLILGDGKVSIRVLERLVR